MVAGLTMALHFSTLQQLEFQVGERTLCEPLSASNPLGTRCEGAESLRIFAFLAGAVGARVTAAQQGF